MLTKQKQSLTDPLFVSQKMSIHNIHLISDALLYPNLQTPIKLKLVSIKDKHN